MILTRKQKAMLHTIPNGLGIPDDQRRMIQQNVGGFHSAADRTVSREGFIAVIAFYEQRAGGKLDGFTHSYWADQNARANPTDAMIHRVRELAGQLGWGAGAVDEFLASKHCSSGQYTTLADCPAYWLRRLIEAMKAIAKRRT